MSLILKFFLIIVLLTGCQSTENKFYQQCEFGVDFFLSETLSNRDELNYSEIVNLISKSYQKNLDNQLKIELVKAYVRNDGLILIATTVISEQQNKNDNKVYYRASEIDNNVASLDVEYQVAIRKALIKTIDKTLLAKKEMCISQQS